MNISRADFQISGLTVGGYFTSVGYLSDLSLQANETRIFSIKWNATVGGHHCIRVVLTYSPATQALQRNIDIENDVVQGGTGEVSFTLVNPFETSKVMTVKVNKQLSSGSEATLEIDGRVFDTSSDIVIEVAPGQELHAILRIGTSTIALENGVVDIEAYVDGQLIEGVRKTIQTIRPYPDFSITGPACRIMMFLPVKLGGGPVPRTIFAASDSLKFRLFRAQSGGKTTSKRGQLLISLERLNCQPSRIIGGRKALYEFRLLWFLVKIVI